MPTLPLPPSASLSGGDLPVSSEEDILLILPKLLKPEDASPVRDAIISALTVMMTTYQSESDEAVAMNDVLQSLDSALVGLAEDRGIYVTDSESSEDLRVRVLSIPDIITPNAIVAAVNSLISPYTTIECQYSESVQDRWYVGAGPERQWHSYVWDDTMSMSPGYKDRLYEDDASSNLGYFRANSNPGGARVYSDAYGRLFMIRIPDLSGVDDLGAFLNSTYTVNRFYVGGSGVASPIRKIGTSTKDLFNLIVSVVNRIKAHSIRWILWMDPKLKS